MHRDLFLTQYEGLRQVGPFCCNIIGVVNAADEVYDSTSGVPMLSFELLSQEKYVVKCMAFGCNAHSEALVPGSEVAIQMAQSRKGKQGERSKLWLYDDSYVALLGAGHELVSSGAVEIELAFVS